MVKLNLKRRWFFQVNTLGDAIDAIKIAYQLTFVYALFHAFLLVFFFFIKRELTLDFLDLILMVALGWAIKTHLSRTAASTLMGYAVFTNFVTLANLVGLHIIDTGSGKNLVITLFLLYATYKGVQGTFGYHRFTGTQVLTKNLFVLWALLLGYLMMCPVVLFVFLMHPTLNEMFSSLSDDMLGLMLMVPIITIFFLGAYRFLPGTRSLEFTETNPNRIPQGPPTNYLVKHWRGELSLATTYWINIFLIGVAFSMFFVLLEESDLWVNNYVLGVQIFTLLLYSSVGIYIWQFGGGWRCAERHIETTGRDGWARLVQGLLVLGLLGAGANFVQNVPSFVEITKIATGLEEYTDYEVNIIEGGREIEIRGHMAFGIENEVLDLLNKQNDVWLLRLNSKGGRINPARKLRDIIVKRGLATYTSEECSSACIIPFLAGTSRILKEDAKLGFHSYHFPGATEEQIQAEIKIDKENFIHSGVNRDFVHKAFNTKAAEMWYPTLEQLIGNHVITHTDNGLEFIKH
jgi:hypothetical protein